MGGGQYCCFPSPGYVIGRGPPSGPAVFGAASGVGYGYGSRSVPIPVPGTSQVLVASHLPPPIPVPVMSNQIPITSVPSTNVYVPTYGQASVVDSPYVPHVVQPVAASIVAPVQPYGINSASFVP